MVQRKVIYVPFIPYIVVIILAINRVFALENAMKRYDDYKVFRVYISNPESTKSLEILR